MDSRFYDFIKFSEKELWGGEFWTDGYYVETVGQHLTEKISQECVRKQEAEKDYEKLHQQPIQMELF